MHSIYSSTHFHSWDLASTSILSYSPNSKLTWRHENSKIRTSSGRIWPPSWFSIWRKESVKYVLGHISVKSSLNSIHFFLLESLGRRDDNVHVGTTKPALPQLEFGLKNDFFLFTKLQTSSVTQLTLLKHLFYGYFTLFLWREINPCLLSSLTWQLSSGFAVYCCQQNRSALCCKSYSRAERASQPARQPASA